MEKYISNPTTIEQAANNAKFQCDNVEGWIYVKNYECALIKAKCLIKALEVVMEMQQTKS